MARLFDFWRINRRAIAKERRHQLHICRCEPLEARQMLAPVAANDNYQMTENTALSISAAAGVQANDTPDMGVQMSSAVVANPGHGTLTLGTDGSLNYTPATNFTGTDDFTYQDSDFAGTSNTATVTITVSGGNDPIAQNDSYTVLHDRANSISAASGVLANDSDPNHLALSASVVAGPSHGSLSLSSNGSFTYTPAAHYTGADSFTYQDSDGTYTSNVAAVSLSVTDPNPPMAMSDNYSAVHDRAFTTTAATGVLANDGDADGDKLSAVLLSQPAHGSLAFNADGSFDYAPDVHYTGSDGFSYKAFDGVLYSAATNVFLNVTNQAPLAWNDSYGLPNSQTLVVSAAAGVLANDTDGDGDALAASLVSGPSHGTLALHADGSFSYTPAIGWVGQDSFAYAASDGIAASNATVTLATQYSVLSLTNLTKPPQDAVQTGLQILGDSSGAAGTARDLSVSYDSIAAQGDAVIEAAAGLSNPANVEETITAALTFNGVAQPNVYFTMQNLGQADATVHLAEQVDTSNLASGRYPFSLTITSPDMAGPATVGGFVNVVNDSASPVGKGWNVPGLLRLFQNNVSGVPAGVLLSTGDGSSWYFTQGTGNAYTSPNGPYAFSTLTSVSGGGWQLVDQHGTTFNFNSSGYLTGRVERTTETTSYGYSSNLLTSITDQFGRSVALAYSAGLLASVTDYAGNVTSFAHAGALLTTITQPNPGGGAPTWTYAYTGNYLSSVTDPMGAQTTYSYDAFHRQSGATLPGGANTADTSEAGFGQGSQNSSSPANLLLQSSVAPVTTDALGHASGYQTDLLGNVVSETDANGNVTTYQRDANGLVTTLTQPSPDGVQPAPVTTYSYDTLGNQTSATGDLASFGVYQYNTFSEPTRFTDLLGHVTSWSYDTHGNLLTKTDPLGDVTTWTVDALGRPLTMTLPDPDGAGPLVSPVYHFAYDTFERLTTLTNPDGTARHFTYDTLDRPLTSEDENSHLTTTGYDVLGRVTSVTNAAGGVTSTTYDKLGRVLTTSDAMGDVTTDAYDSAGELSSVTLPDPDGAGPLTSPLWSFTYDANGDKLTQTDPLGRVTSWSYDNLGRVSTVTLPDPDGAGPLTAPVTTYGYDHLGRKILETNALGGVTLYAYNANNWLTSVTAPDPDGSGPLTSPIIAYGYDAIGEQTTVTDPLGHVATTAYDADGQKSSVTDNLNHATTFGYDHLGDLLTTTDALSHVTTDAYDSRSRIVSTTDALGGVTSYTRDGAGNVLTLKDPDNNTDTWTYDTLNRVVTDTDQLGHAKSYSYDASSDLTNETDRDGRVRDFTYDDLHRETSEKWMSGSTAIYVIAYGYDAADELLTASDADSSYTFGYDADGNVLTADNNGTPGVPDVLLTSVYDSMGDRTGLSASIAGAKDFANSFSYDADQRMTMVQQQGQSGGNAVSQKEVDFAYNALGQYSKIVDYNFFGVGPRTDVATGADSYDAANRLTGLSYSSNAGANQIDAFGWGYDNANNVTSFTSSFGTATYSVDATNQVTGASYSGANQPANENYSFDSNGNRTNTGYSTGANNLLTSDGTFNYGYDNEGNRTTRTRISNSYATDYKTTYAWDYRDRLNDVEYFDNNGVLTKHVHYIYGVFDHLLGTEVDTTGGGSYNEIERYVLDVSPEIPQANVPGTSLAQPLLQFDGAGNLTTRYLEAVDRIFAEGAVTSPTSPDTVTWMLADNLGSVREVLDNNSNVIDRINYNSFGQVAFESSPAVHHFAGYTGGHLDPTTGLINDYHRWYDPATGRWTSQDPRGFAAGDPNQSRYASDDAINRIDPTRQSHLIFGSISRELKKSRGA